MNTDQDKGATPTTGDSVKPTTLPADTYTKVLARAQRIFDRLGRPPYKARYAYDLDPVSEQDQEYTRFGSEDEAHVLSEFVTFWLPYLVEKIK